MSQRAAAVFPCSSSDMPDFMQKRPLKVAILDLYRGGPNEGMRCIRDLLDEASARYGGELTYDEFEVRIQNQVPDLSYDAFVSTGGGGSPFDGEGGDWEPGYFRWLDDLLAYNVVSEHKKHGLFICHSFQLLCRHLGLGSVVKRRSESFGMNAVHLTADGCTGSTVRWPARDILRSRFPEVASSAARPAAALKSGRPHTGDREGQAACAVRTGRDGRQGVA